MRSVWLKLIVSLALLAWLLARTPLTTLALELARLNATSLTLGAGLAFASWLMSAVRLWCIAPGFGLATITRMTFVGLLYGTLLPGQVAGDVVKAWRLSKTQTTPGLAAAATLVDRGIGTLALFAIGAVAALRLSEAPHALRLLLVLTTLAIVATGALLASARAHQILVALLQARSEGFIGRLLGFLEQLAHALHDALRRPVRIAASLVFAFVFHALCVSIHLLLAHALGVTVDVAMWCLVYAGVSLLMLLPISVAGIGLREGGYVGLLALFGINREIALAISFVFLGYTLLGALIGGALELRTILARTRSHRDMKTVSGANTTANRRSLR